MDLRELAVLNALEALRAATNAWLAAAKAGGAVDEMTRDLLGDAAQSLEAAHLRLVRGPAMAVPTPKTPEKITG